MNDYWHTLTNWVDHNRYVFVALVAAAMLSVPSCDMFQASGISPFSGESVSADEHAAEWNAFLLTSEQTVQGLDQQMALLSAKRAALIEQVISTESASDTFMLRLEERQNSISEGTGALWSTVKSLYPPATAADPLIAPVIGILGFGAFADARRKNKLLNSRNTNTSSTT